MEMGGTPGSEPQKNKPQKLSHRVLQGAVPGKFELENDGSQKSLGSTEWIL